MPRAPEDLAIDPVPGSPSPPERVLLVEDNPLIALDVEDHLRALGVGQVDVASSSELALELLEGGGHGFALLDFNLGGETSEPVARALDRRGIPFAFATGYGEVECFAEGLVGKEVPVLIKPYAKAELEDLMRRLIPA